MATLTRALPPPGRGRPPRLRRWRRDGEMAEFVRGAAAADHVRPRGLSHVLLFTVAAFFAVFLYWADWATLDEVTRGEGRVIPSSQVQVIQNLEGGIVAAILVHEGDEVQKGQVLLRIDNSRAASDYEEKQSRYWSLLAASARLRAEIEGSAIQFPPEVMEHAPATAASERALYEARQQSLKNDVQVLASQADQRQQELRELKSKLGQAQRSYDLASQELAIRAPLASQRIVSKSDMLQLERQVNDLKGQVDQTQLGIPRAESAVNEANQRIAGARSAFLADAQKTLTAVQSELAGLKAVIAAGEDRVKRTEVRSPVHGTIKQLNFNTIGGVIQPGERMLEIVPLEDSLLIEAQVRPADIAFLRPGLPATVKVTAYDFARYGGLEGKVEDISADTIKNDKNESFYRVRVRTAKNHLGSDEHPLDIIPGMTAQVDVLTGHRTVLAYLMKPILRAYDNALHER